MHSATVTIGDTLVPSQDQGNRRKEIPGGVAYVQLITHEYRFKATVYTQGRRLLDVLNDSLTEYLQIRDAEIYRANTLQQHVAKYAEGLVRKNDLHLAIITSEKHEAPIQRLFGYVQKIPYPVFVTVPGHEVRGTIHILQQQASLNAIAILNSLAGTFVPVTRATVAQAWTGDEVLTCPVVMVNRHSLSLFCLGDEVTSP